jgi:hypothetical protein
MPGDGGAMFFATYRHEGVVFFGGPGLVARAALDEPYEIAAWPSRPLPTVPGPSRAGGPRSEAPSFHVSFRNIFIEEGPDGWRVTDVFEVGHEDPFTWTSPDPEARVPVWSTRCRPRPKRPGRREPTSPEDLRLDRGALEVLRPLPSGGPPLRGPLRPPQHRGHLPHARARRGRGAPGEGARARMRVEGLRADAPVEIERGSVYRRWWAEGGPRHRPQHPPGRGAHATRWPGWPSILALLLVAFGSWFVRPGAGGARQRPAPALRAGASLRGARAGRGRAGTGPSCSRSPASTRRWRRAAPRRAGCRRRPSARRALLRSRSRTGMSGVPEPHGGPAPGPPLLRDLPDPPLPDPGARGRGRAGPRGPQPEFEGGGVPRDLRPGRAHPGLPPRAGSPAPPGLPCRTGGSPAPGAGPPALRGGLLPGRTGPRPRHGGGRRGGESRLFDRFVGALASLETALARVPGVFLAAGWGILSSSESPRLPELEACVRCGGPPDGGPWREGRTAGKGGFARFDIEAGGLRCPGCAGPGTPGPPRGRRPGRPGAGPSSPGRGGGPDALSGAPAHFGILDRFALTHLGLSRTFRSAGTRSRIAPARRAAFAGVTTVMLDRTGYGPPDTAGRSRS